MRLSERYRRLTFWNKAAWWGSIASFIGLGWAVSQPIIAMWNRPDLAVRHSIAVNLVRVDSRHDSSFATVSVLDVLAGCVERMVSIHGAKGEVVVGQGSVEVLRRFELRNRGVQPLTQVRLIIYKFPTGTEDISATPNIDASYSEYSSADAHAGTMKVITIPNFPPRTTAIVSYRVRVPDPGSADKALGSLTDPTIVSISALELVDNLIAATPVTFLEMNEAEQRVLRASLPIEPFTTTDQFRIIALTSKLYSIWPDTLLGPSGRFACRARDGSHKVATNTNLFRPSLTTK